MNYKSKQKKTTTFFKTKTINAKSHPTALTSFAIVSATSGCRSIGTFLFKKKKKQSISIVNFFFTSMYQKYCSLLRSVKLQSICHQNSIMWKGPRRRRRRRNVKELLLLTVATTNLLLPVTAASCYCCGFSVEWKYFCLPLWLLFRIDSTALRIFFACGRVLWRGVPPKQQRFFCFLCCCSY